jgi:glycosyltransferase involved in cell wall biosynthesis
LSRRAFRAIRRLPSRVRRWSRTAMRWRRILAGRAAQREKVRVFYGHDHIPGANEAASGGTVKFQRLQEEVPNAPRDFNILYLGSSTRPHDTRQLLWLARRRDAPIVWNQNGVAYPGWAGRATGRINRPLALGLHAADHVFYQSEFCRLSADRFLGVRAGPSEVLYNCVDTKVFTPGDSRPRKSRLTLLLAGSHNQLYRLDAALRTVAQLLREGADVQLRVAGRLSWLPDGSAARRVAAQLADELGIAGRVEFSGPYTQVEALGVFRSADILLHTQYNDACPGLVVEAMASGLPVVHSASGGVPELVGEEAGIGVPAPLDWERVHPPEPEALAQAVLRVAERREDYREAARRRAVARFDIRPWVARHRDVFRELLR